MANADRPYGFRPVGTFGSASYNGQIRKYYVPADNSAAIFIGDLVSLAGTSDAQRVYPQDVLYPEATVGINAAVHIGVCVGIEPLYSDLTINYRKASTAMYIYVDCDPNTIYSVQGDSGAWTVADVGNNAAITYTGGNTTTGRSKQVITTPSQTIAHGVQIVGVDPDPGNEVGVYWKMLVKLTYHQFGTDGNVGIS